MTPPRSRTPLVGLTASLLVAGFLALLPTRGARALCTVQAGCAGNPGANQRVLSPDTVALKITDPNGSDNCPSSPPPSSPLNGFGWINTQFGNIVNDPLFSNFLQIQLMQALGKYKLYCGGSNSCASIPAPFQCDCTTKAASAAGGCVCNAYACTNYQYCSGGAFNGGCGGYAANIMNTTCGTCASLPIVGTVCFALTVPQFSVSGPAATCGSPPSGKILVWNPPIGVCIGSSASPAGIQGVFTLNSVQMLVNLVHPTDPTCEPAGCGVNPPQTWCGVAPGGGCPCTHCHFPGTTSTANAVDPMPQGATDQCPYIQAWGNAQIPSVNVSGIFYPGFGHDDSNATQHFQSLQVSLQSFGLSTQFQLGNWTDTCTQGSVLCTNGADTPSCILQGAGYVVTCSPNNSLAQCPGLAPNNGGSPACNQTTPVCTNGKTLDITSLANQIQSQVQITATNSFCDASSGVGALCPYIAPSPVFDLSSFTQTTAADPFVNDPTSGNPYYLWLDAGLNSIGEGGGATSAYAPLIYINDTVGGFMPVSAAVDLYLTNLAAAPSPPTFPPSPYPPSYAPPPPNCVQGTPTGPYLTGSAPPTTSINLMPMYGQMSIGGVGATSTVWALEGKPTQSYMFGLALHTDALNPVLFDFEKSGGLCARMGPCNPKGFSLGVSSYLTTSKFRLFMPALYNKVGATDMELRLIPTLNATTLPSLHVGSIYNQFVTGFTVPSGTKGIAPGGVTSDLAVELPGLQLTFYAETATGNCSTLTPVFGLGITAELGLSLAFTNPSAACGAGGKFKYCTAPNVAANTCSVRIINLFVDARSIVASFTPYGGAGLIFPSDTVPPTGTWKRILGNLLPVLLNSVIWGSSPYGNNATLAVGLDLCPLLRSAIYIDPGTTFIGTKGDYLVALLGLGSSTLTAPFLFQVFNYAGISGFFVAPELPSADDLASGGGEAAPGPHTSITANTRPAPDGTLVSFAGIDPADAPDDLWYSWAMDGGTWHPPSHVRTVELDGLLEGKHTFVVRATNRLQQTEEIPAVLDFRVDSIPPDLWLRPQPRGSGVAVTARDDQTPPEGISLSWRVDGGAWGDWVPYLDHREIPPGSRLSVGSHRIEVRSRDDVGNVGASSLEIEVPRGASPGCACSSAGGAGSPGPLDAWVWLLPLLPGLFARRRLGRR